MTEEESLAKAYLEFSLEGGSSLEEINDVYKDLVMAWHSDRYPVGKKRQKAEEKMKKINNARDLLKKHFAESHKATGYCACRGSAGSGASREKTTTGQTSGPGKEKTAQQNAAEEAEARRRNEERARRAAEESAAAKAKADAASAAAAAAAKSAADKRANSEQSMQSALEQTKLAQDEQLRWKISICMLVAWVCLNIVGAMSMNAKAWWHDFSWKWDRDHPSTPPTQAVPQTSTPGYVPPYNKFPGGDQNSWQQQQDLDQQRRDEQAEKQKKQDIYDTRMALDRYQKTIEHCTSEIAKIDAQLADPLVSDYEKRKSLVFQNAQRGYLAQAQSDLAEAQKRFTELTGRPASEANLTDWSPTASPTITPPANDSSSLLNGPNFTSQPSSPPANSNLTEPWRPSYTPNSSGLAPFKTPPSTYSTPDFTQDSLFKTDPSKSTNPIFAKPNYLFRKNQ